MKAVVTGLVSAGLTFALAGSAGASPRKHHHHSYRDNSPSAIAERQRHASTFDPTQYYEHQLDKVPFGTQTWWDQYDREHGGQRR